MLTKLKEYLYPGMVSLDISPLDGTLVFYDRVNALCPPNATVLDYGASSGKSMATASLARQRLLLLAPNAVRRIGVDVDDGVLHNPYLEKGHLLGAADGFRMPLAAESVDLAVADWVVEHLPAPADSFKDIHRVLKPGGWFCARTVNVWHYAFALANLVKNTALEKKLLRAAQGERHTWPKAYRANSRRKLKRLVGEAGFQKIVIVPWEPEPAYLMRNSATLLAGAAWQKLAGTGLLPQATLLLFAQKSEHS